MNHKLCNSCNKKKPATTEYFHKHSGCKYGVCPQCKECYKEQSREYYHKNKESVCKRTTKYRNDNPEWYREYKRNYRRKHRLKYNLSRGLWGCLSGKLKKTRTLNYVGCSLEELWLHLESKFTEGMTRENYGSWHVDHKIPLNAFDFTGSNYEEQLSIAWNYTNLQPLWAKDNFSKGHSLSD